MNCTSNAEANRTGNSDPRTAHSASHASDPSLHAGDADYEEGRFDAVGVVGCGALVAIAGLTLAGVDWRKLVFNLNRWKK